MGERNSKGGGCLLKAEAGSWDPCGRAGAALADDVIGGSEFLFAHVCLSLVVTAWLLAFHIRFFWMSAGSI